MLITLLAGAFILSVVIIVHEFGHFIVAKKLGIYVKTFSVGFGRKLLRKRVGETVYALSMLPFGGYVKFAGESEDGKTKEAPQGVTDDETPDSEIAPDRYFVNKSPYVRGAVVFAGPFSNYVLAIVVFAATLIARGVPTVPDTMIGEVISGSTAESAGLLSGDRVVAIDGETVSEWYELEEKLDDGDTHRLTVQRDSGEVEIDYALGDDDNRFGFYEHLSAKVGQVKRDAPAYQAGIRTGAVIVAINDTLVGGYDDVVRMIHASPESTLFVEWTQDGVQHADSITPQARKVAKDDTGAEFDIVGQIGIGPYYEWRRISVYKALTMAVSSSTDMVVRIIGFLKRVFTGKAGIDAVGGPILITQMAGDMARWGFNNLLYFLAFFSVNLCIFNLLPILPFDGGHLALFTYEAIARRRVNRKVRDILAQAGFVLLILLMVFVVLVDVSRCVGSSPSLF